MIVGMMRIKNEARWISLVLNAALAVCDRIFVLDDHSNDGTREICRSFPNVVLFESPFEGLDEARDKNWLFDLVKAFDGDWCLSIDGDEILEDPHGDLRAAAKRNERNCYALRVLYLWDRVDQVRDDGIYGRFWRASFFRIRRGDSFAATQNGGNFHCGNVPNQIRASSQCGARLLHLGYMKLDDRRRKFDWYNRMDPNNLVEDRYLHMVQGDPGGPPAEAVLRHAGPLTLRPRHGNI